MHLMDELARWLGAQLDEDELIARAAIPGPWEWLTETGESWQPRPGGWLDYSGEYLAAPGDGATLFGPGMTPHADAVFIAAHDPARVLREIEVKRRIVDRYAWLREHGDTGGTAWVLPLLALPYADRPGYREEWRP